jgi:hypothetical protein
VGGGFQDRKALGNMVVRWPLFLCLMIYRRKQSPATTGGAKLQISIIRRLTPTILPVVQSICGAVSFRHC